MYITKHILLYTFFKEKHHIFQIVSLDVFKRNYQVTYIHPFFKNRNKAINILI